MNSIGLQPATTADNEFCYRLHRAAMRPYVEAIWGWDEATQRDFHQRGFNPSQTQIITVDDRVLLTAGRCPRSSMTETLEGCLTRSVLARALAHRARNGA